MKYIDFWFFENSKKLSELAMLYKEANEKKRFI